LWLGDDGEQRKCEAATGEKEEKGGGAWWEW
jgi:hypothetical protein